MNCWKGTVILKNDPVLQTNEGKDTLKFTGCNTLDVRGPSGAILYRKEFWLDCVWENPDWAQASLFTAKSLVSLEGPIYDHDYRRQDGSRATANRLEVDKGTWLKQMGGSVPQKPDSSSE